MRNLTITRNKTFVACLAKMKVYIEDPAEGNTFINDIPCRKLGTLKNGEKKTFVIGDEECRVFVIADRLSKGFCNDFYTIPAGMYDVELSGKNRYNPATGNAFRFDDVDDEAVLKNRKKGLWIGICVLVAAVLIGFTIGFLANFPFSAKDKIFEIEDMNITLTNEFSKVEMDGYTACYGTPDVSLFIIKEEFALAEGFEDLSPAEYGNLVLQTAEPLESTELQTIDGLTCFEYQFKNPETNDSYYYFASVFKTTDAFWIVQFATASENADTYRSAFIDWLKTVSF